MFRNRELKKLAEYFVLLQVNKKKYPDVYKKAGRYVAKRWPSSYEYVFCDPSGEEIEGMRLRRPGKIKDIKATMKAVLEKTGRGVLKSVYVECKSAFDKGEALFAAGNYSDAVKILKKLSAKKRVELTFIDEAKKILSEIDKRGAELLKQAKEAIEKEDYESALKALFELTVCFNGLPIKSEAQSELNKLKGLEGAAEAYKEAENIAKARKIYIQAETFLIEGNAKRAAIYYKKLVRGYKDTEYAEKAEAKLSELESQ